MTAPTAKAAKAASTAKAAPPTLAPSLLLAIGGGVAYFLGFAGFDFYPFAFVALVPLVLLLERERESSWRRRASLAFLYGIVEFAGGYSWMQTFLETFSGFPFFATAGITAIFCGYLALFTVLFAWIYGRARERGVAPAAVTVAATVALESTFPMIFPSYLGNALHAVPVAIQIADIGGPVLVSAYLALVNGAVAELVLAKMGARKMPKVVLGFAGAATVFVFGYGAYRISEVDTRAAAAPTLRVAMVQVNMGTFAKREDPAEGHRRHLEQSRRIESDEGGPPDLFVWPESAFTFPVPPDDAIARVVRRDIRAPVLFGGLDLRQGDTPGRDLFYNTAFLLDGPGRVVGRYDKTYLVPFGEYIPFGDVFPSVYDLSPNTGHFEAGTREDSMSLGRARMTVFVCYEDLLPEFTRRLVAHGRPNLLVNLTNDAWYGNTHEPWIHLALSKFRAVEHHRALVRSTNSGVSAFIDPVGRVIDHTGVFTREELVTDLPLLSRGTAFEVTGAYPYAGLGVLACLLFVFRKPRAV
jgi:apolipoprotein N-acyltransferase